MINSYVQNSSSMSTEDGGSSTVYGGPTPAHASAHHAGHRHTFSSYPRPPPQDYFYGGEPTSASAATRGAGSGENFYRTRQHDTIDTSRVHQSSESPRWGGQGAPNTSTIAGDDASSSPPLPIPARAQRTDTTALQQHPQQKAVSEQAQALLEVVLSVSLKLPAQEAQLRPLGVYVRTGRGGPNNVTRLVLVRLTDPSDPFFLYELELLEDDYGAFKQRLELLVDFSGFPRYLVNMLRDIADGASPYELSLVLHSASNTSEASRATLRVLETTEFKTVEHISLLLLRQGDAGLKKYLAERFQFYEHSFRSAEAARTSTTAQLQAEVDCLRGESADLHNALRSKEEELRFAVTDAEKSQLAALNRLRDQHNKETNALRESYEKKLETHSRALEERAQQLRDTTTEKDTTINALRSRVTELESTAASLQSQLRSAQDTSGIQAKELETLREMNDELTNFKAEAAKAMSENELNYVTLTERLRGTSTALQSREEKVAALQAHYEKQDAYIRILAEQNTQQADRLRETERNLEKAHHILANQLQTIKSARERYRIAADQLRSQEALVQEKDGTVRRQRDEVTAANERIQELLRTNNDLRDQLEKTNSAREQLVQEVKQTQQALLRLQQSTSINGRHWGILSSGSGGAGGGGGAFRAGTGAGSAAVDDRYRYPTSLPADLMREFGANSRVVSPGGYRNAGAYGAATAPSSNSGLGGGGTGAGTSPGNIAQNGRSLFHAQATASTSPSPAYNSQERAGSSETGGLTEPHGRTSTSSLGKTEPSPASSSSHQHARSSSSAAPTAGMGRAQPIVRSVSLEKPLPGATARSPSPFSSSSPAANPNSTAIRSSYNDLAVKSFLNADVAVTAGTELQSAYF